MSRPRNKQWIAWSFGVVYLLFGILKFFPDASPAQELAIQTIHRLFNGAIPEIWSIKLLAGWEVLIGLLFFLKGYLKPALILGLVHMVLTFTPLLFFPELCWVSFPRPTLLTQYILKNLVFIATMIGIYPR